MKCCDCKQNLDVTDFYKNQKRCKKCTSVRNAIFKSKNPGYYSPGGKGYYYDRAEDVDLYNRERYAKYKGRYKEYNLKFRQSERGALYSIFKIVKTRAKKKGYELDFDLDWVVSLYNTQKGCCFSTGIKFDLTESSRVKKFRPLSVSLDRIDSNKGYSKDNVRLVCVAFNLALNSFGEGIFEKIALGFLKNKNKITSA